MERAIANSWVVISYEARSPLRLRVSLSPTLVRQPTKKKTFFFLLLQHTLALLGHISDKSMIRELKVCLNNDDCGVVKEKSRLLESNLELKQIKGSFILSFSIRIQFPLLS